MVVVVGTKVLKKLLDRPSGLRAGMNVVKTLVKVFAKADDLAVVGESDGKESGDIIRVQFTR